MPVRLERQGEIVGVGSTRHFTEDDLPVVGSEASGTMQLAAVQAQERHFNSCTAVFEVPVKRVDFYTVHIGHRGDLSFSLDDLEAQDFFVRATLGTG